MGCWKAERHTLTIHLEVVPVFGFKLCKTLWIPGAQASLGLSGKGPVSIVDAIVSSNPPAPPKNRGYHRFIPLPINPCVLDTPVCKYKPGLERCYLQIDFLRPTFQLQNDSAQPKVLPLQNGFRRNEYVMARSLAHPGSMSNSQSPFVRKVFFEGLGEDWKTCRLDTLLSGIVVPFIPLPTIESYWR